MAFNDTPTAWLPGYTSNGTTISIPIATFPELTVDEAHATTGDIRRILFAIADKMFKTYNALPESDRPARVEMFKSASIDVNTNVLTNSYTQTYECNIAGQEVLDEPV